MKRNFNHFIIGFLSFWGFPSGNAEENSSLPVKKWLNVSFVSHPTRDLALDIFRSSDSKKRPAVLCLHGGFWAKGSKKIMHHIAEEKERKDNIAE